MKQRNPLSLGIAINTKSHVWTPAALLVLCLTAFTFALPAGAQTWIELNPGNSPPDPTYQPSPVHYDASNNRLIVFHPPHDPPYGGVVDQVWVLTNANGLGGTPTWIQLQPTGTPPFSNNLESVVYETATNRLIVYGGCYWHCSPALGEVFVLTNANGLGGTSNWSQSTLDSFQRRTHHSAVLDSASNRMVTFGGNTAFFGTDKNDTRVLSKANGVESPSSWTTLSTSGGPPPIRNQHTTVYDPGTNRMILYAGVNYRKDYCCGIPYGNMQWSYGDLWILSNANGLGGTPTWLPQTPLGTLPATRFAHTAVYDGPNNRMIVFGGRSVTHYETKTFASLGDLWELSNANGLGGTPTWTQLSQSGTPPGPRFYHTAAFDTANQRMIVLGGTEEDGTLSSRVWVLILNAEPTANAGVDQTVECTSESGSPVTLDGSGSSDPDDEPLTCTWTGPFGTATGVSPTVTLPIGTSTISLVVNDGKVDSPADTVDVTVPDTSPPALNLNSNSVTVVLPTSSAMGASVNVLAASQASALDACDPNPTLAPAGTSDYPIGSTTVMITASDCQLNAVSNPFNVSVVYNFSGFLPPIRTDGTSIFRSGRTIPVKFQLTAADGSIVSNATATLEVGKVTDVVTGIFDVITPEASGNSNLDNLFRYDPTSGQYIYNLSTRGYTTGTYVVRATLDDGTTHDVYVSVR